MSNQHLSLSRKQSRELDFLAIEEFNMPSIILMENARRGVAEYFLSHYIRGNIVICFGKGDNSGDGLVVARYLDNQNCPVHIILICDISRHLRRF